MGRSTRLRLLIAALALALLAGACGSSSRSDSADDGSGGGDGSTATTAGESTEAAFGDLPSPCGPAAEGTTNAAGEQGVTADSVTIGYGDDAGYQASPGLNHQMSDAIEAMIDWCNEQGGINGREVVGNYYDAKITEIANVMTEACGQVFMLVGEGWALSASGEQARLACDLPAVPGLVGGADLGMAPLMVSPVPFPVDYNSVQNAAALAEAFPEEVTKAAAFYPTLPVSVEQTEKVFGSYPSLGWQFLDCSQQYAITGEADWKPFVQKLKDCGVEAVYFSGGNPNFQNVLDAAQQLDYDPIWAVESNFYDPQFAEWNQNGNADNVYVRYTSIPFESAEPGSATQQYMDLVQGAGGDISSLGVQATSAFLLWATAAKECGADLTRACVMDELRKITEWTGGGLHAEQDPGGNKPGDCGMVLKMDGTKFVQWSPETTNEYACNPDYLVRVDPPATAEADLLLDADRQAQKNAG